MRKVSKPTLVTSVSALLVFALAGYIVLRATDAGSVDTSSDPWPPVILIGVDGADWSVIRELWRRGGMPNLAALAKRGISAELETAYASSPVIWTSVATGLRAEDHGITGFTVSTEGEDILVLSKLRRAPALWNMLTSMNRRVAVLGWWVTWPAEKIEGIMISDRFDRDLDHRFHPPDLARRYGDELASLERLGEPIGALPTLAQRKDRIVRHWATLLVGREFDLTMAYFTTPDKVSHLYWKYWEPKSLESVDAKSAARYQHVIPEAYETVDRAIGEILGAAPPDAVVFVISDHGFSSRSKPKIRIQLDFDALLEATGFLERRPDGSIDLTKTLLITHSAHQYQDRRMLRSPRPNPDSSALRTALERELSNVTYESGEPVVKVLQPTQAELARGADLAVEIQTIEPSDSLLYRDERLDDVVLQLTEVSGTHDTRDHGILVAAGPSINPGAEVKGISIFDIAPTILYALGLPIGKNFAGDAKVELFHPSFRAQTPLRTIPEWKLPTSEQKVLGSEIDQEILNELRALGYLE